jgi:hypothetical protein
MVNKKIRTLLDPKKGIQNYFDIFWEKEIAINERYFSTNLN